MMRSTISRDDLDRRTALTIEPGGFEPSRHFYPRTLNAQVHPLVAFFMRLCIPRLVARYCHLNPSADPDVLNRCLRSETRYFHWGGADLFYTVTEAGVRRMTVLETNSCPSGNKSMPILTDDNEYGGYRTLIDHAFVPRLRRGRRGEGALAVIYDKNFVEASGYAAALADITDEPVYLAPCVANHPDPPVRVVERTLEVRDHEQRWRRVRGAMRYVTQKPWQRIPVATRTALTNPIIACLAGGRNKLVAATAYELMNAHLARSGLRIRAPETIRDVAREEVPLWVDRFGGYAVIKNPYSNAGQGVFTVTSARELERFMSHAADYDRFIVQGLIGNSSWTTSEEGSRYYHVGTVPDRHGHIYVADLRVMVCSGPAGFTPVALYARRAREPLRNRLGQGEDSWPMLGTNLSVKNPRGGWLADTDRLMLMDRRDFNRLGLGLDDLIEAYVQTVLAVLAIDRMASTLTGKRGDLKRRLFRSLNPDEAMMRELWTPAADAAS